ncbi:hypothetical protein KL942_004374 [Ogataea angusta]|uniref:UBX domain-containing protein 1 n=1 Tax=Pichia angusta TaxID=870730 RepID=A0AAN6DBF0_PICAN|nr:uncharacterized protein KL928_004770 [Ogataea angusta]KAG7816214.1 hypothetical protein KL928_004770 [Ogataea angusta]KAG7822514.1 hypothetical protein KL909_004202 [Ogataea angusta]KAG7827460.1 hypothetical protein KL920_004714 [Ogataea angusta]KAG7837486.1 hypothetical protein KL942_004374 [Ogataea angusta]KAG7847595.1 hypothetical protein KL940_003507 [Ogataea angusta]
MSEGQFVDKFRELTGAPETRANNQESINQYYLHATSEPEPKRDPGSQIKSFSDIKTQDEDDEDTNLFTGGEKSGLEVENPDKNPLGLVEQLIKKAEREGSEPDRRRPIEPKKSKFTGTGYKLGSVDKAVESQVIEDAKQKGYKVPEKVTRTITFWKEGFQVGDGKLYRYDDPENADYLRQLNSGRAPLSLLNVEMFQDVDVTVIKKMDESYTPSKPKQGGFTGRGQRLGSPVPGEPIPEPIVAETAQKPEKAPAEDLGSGDAKVQIRMADGTRLIHMFDSNDNVSAVFDFVRSHTDSSRDWNLAFAFPMKVIEQDSKTIKEAGLINSVVVQRWK